MSASPTAIDAVLDAAWNRAIGELEWLKAVVFGEFEDNRPLSAVVADMLVSFVPGVIIVTSARDLTAVVIRMANHPEKREEVGEWILLIGCAIPLVLPILAAAAGLAAAGVGAVVGGIGGSEAGAALRAVCLMLLERGGVLLAEMIGFLRRFIKGNILTVLRDIKFVQYAEALVKYLGEFIGKLIRVVGKVRGELLELPQVQRVADILEKLESLEHAFYDIQRRATKAVPLALAELDARLQKLLAEVLERDERLAYAGVPAPHAHPVTPIPAHVPAMSDNPLGRPHGTVDVPEMPPPVEKTNLHPEEQKAPPTKKIPETEIRCFKCPADKLEEMTEQLAAQEKAINSMTVEQYLQRRDEYKYNKLMGEKTRDPSVARDARAEYEENLRNGYIGEYMSENPDADPEAAIEWATKRAADDMKTLAALHNPDIVAGGADEIGDFGDRVVNSAIGGQWVSNVKEEGMSRVEKMDRAAEAIPKAERASSKMNVKLKPCR